MMKRIKRLFMVKTRFEVFLVTYGLAVGATTRGYDYIEHYPGWIGKFMFACCTVAVFMAGAKMLEAVDLADMFKSEQ